MIGSSFFERSDQMELAGGGGLWVGVLMPKDDVETLHPSGRISQEELSTDPPNSLSALSLGIHVCNYSSSIKYQVM